MRKGFASLAVVGIAACAAVFAFMQQPQSTSLYNDTFSSADMEYIKYVSEFGKSYGTKEEYQFRSETFKKTLAALSEVNAQNDITYRVGVNMFADWTPAEYKRLLGYKRVPKMLRDGETKTLPTDNLPTSVDWRAKGAVNAPKDQKQCGSCWAFSAVAAIEGHHAIKTGELLNLSEQQLVDCSRSFGNEGCNGGEMYAAFQYAEGVALETGADYPYKGKDGSCVAAADKGKVSVTGWNRVPVNDPEQLKAAIALGPVSVAIEADQLVFQFYSGGIFSSARCGTKLDHGVTAVGYGVENGKEFYIVRNSWGASWGESGYIRMAVTSGAGICGIQMDSVYPETN